MYHYGNSIKLLTTERPILKSRSEYKLEPKLFLPSNAERKGEGGLRTKSYFKKSYDNKPLISVVTVVYNGEKYLEQTINSVLEQSYDNVEYIIIDGGSSDGTLGIIKKYEEQIDYWVSEPDSGIYDAMNKGISCCSGDYVAFLNADDWYCQDGIDNIVFSINHDPVSYVFANVDIYDNKNKFKLTYKSHINRYQFMMPFGHPTLFVRRAILLSFPFDEKYPTAADYDFICKIIEKKLSFSYIDKSIVNFREGGISHTTNTEKELVKLRYKHFGIFIALRFYIITTKQPIISKLVRIFVKIKHMIKQGRVR